MANAQHRLCRLLSFSLALCACDAQPTLSFRVTLSGQCADMCDALDRIDIYLLKSVGGDRWCLLDTATAVPRGERTFDDVPLEEGEPLGAMVFGECRIGTSSGSISRGWCCRTESPKVAGDSAGSVPISLEFSPYCSSPQYAGCP